MIICVYHFKYLRFSFSASNCIGAIVGTFGDNRDGSGQVNVFVECVSVAMTGNQDHSACKFLIMN